MSLIGKPDPDCTAPSITTKKEAADALSRLRDLESLLGIQVTDRDQAMQEAAKAFQGKITYYQTEITSLKAQLEAWARQNRDEFVERRQLDLYAGSMRFKLGPPKLVLRCKWDWKKVLGKILSFGPTSQWHEYVLEKPELDKAKLLADAKDKEGPGTAVLGPGRLETIGLRLDQEEFFYIEIAPEKGAIADVPCP